MVLPLPSETTRSTFGTLALAQGGTAADLSASGGFGYFVQQPTAGGSLVSQLFNWAVLPMPAVFFISDNNSNTTPTAIQVQHQYSGFANPSPNFGIGIEFDLSNNGGTPETGFISNTWLVPTTDAQFKFWVMVSNVLTQVATLSGNGLTVTGNINIATSGQPNRLYALSADNVGTTNIIVAMANNQTQGVSLNWSGLFKVGSTPNTDLVINANGSGNILLHGAQAGYGTASTGFVGIGINIPLTKLDLAGGFFHAQFNNSSAPPNAAGLFINWNGATGSNGETDYINNWGGGFGGHYFYNTNAASFGTLLGGFNNVGLFAGGISFPTQFNTSGLLIAYRGDTTVANGLASNIGHVGLIGQTATIVPTNIFTPPVDGEYVAFIVYTCTTAGTGGTVSIGLRWTDANGATSNTTATLSLTALGQQFATVPMHARTTAAIQYLTTVAGATGSPQYSVYINILRLS